MGRRRAGGTEDGGLTVTLRHPFTTVQEAANLLNSLGPPFGNVVFEYAATDDEVTVTMTGTLSLPGGTWDAFGDQAMLTSTGGTPFGAQLAETGANPAESMAVGLSVRLPGEIEETTGDRRDGAAHVVGSARRFRRGSGDAGRAQRRRRRGLGRATLGTAALVLLIAWLVIGIAFVVLVLRARGRRRAAPYTASIEIRQGPPEPVLVDPALPVDAEMLRPQAGAQSIGKLETMSTGRGWSTR